jgi:hypothetical protein
MSDDLAHYMEATERMRIRAEGAERELDRLRVVVDAARKFARVAELPGPSTDPAATVEAYVASRRALIQTVAALDGYEDP